MTNVFENIEEWADQRNIIEGATQHAQLVKLMEEMGELASGVARGNLDLIKDSIGDCAVVLTILAAQNNLVFEECVESAYEEIKDRKGRMKDGIFVKEEDDGVTHDQE